MYRHSSLLPSRIMNGAEICLEGAIRKKALGSQMGWSLSVEIRVKFKDRKEEYQIKRMIVQ